MFPLRPHLEPSTAHIGNTGADALPNATRHGTGTIAPVSVLSPAQRGFATGPAQARPSTPTTAAGASQRHTQAGTSGNQPSNRRGNIVGTAPEHAPSPDAPATSMPPDLQQIQSMLGLDTPQGWDDFRQFVEMQSNASTAVQQHLAPQVPPTPQELEQIRHAAGLHSPEDWAAFEQFVRSRLASSSNAQTDTSTATTPHASDSSHAQPVASTPATGSRPARYRMVLEDTVKQPRDNHASIRLTNKRLYALPDDINVTYGNTSTVDRPSRKELESYVKLFLEKYGYNVDIISSNANTTLLRATNPASDEKFYVHARASSSHYTVRPMAWSRGNALIPADAPQIMAVVNHSSIIPSQMAQIYLVHI